MSEGLHIQARSAQESEKNQSDLESFKQEYNHDMEELGEALKDFRVNNKK
jgi:phage-related minor tail protein